MEYNWEEIKNNFKDNIYASYQIPDGVYVEDLEELLNCSVLNHCGCGCNQSNLELIYHLLKYQKELFDNDYKNYKKSQEKLIFYIKSHAEEVLQFIWYQLNELEILEHGGSIPGWLSDKGKHFFDLLEQYILAKENENN